MAVGFITGILGGQVYLEKIHLSLFLGISLILLVGIVAKIYQYKGASVFLLVILWGGLWTVKHPVLTEQKYFTENQRIILEGQVLEIKESKFSNTLILKEVTLQNPPYYKKIHSKILVNFSQLPIQINPYDKIRVKGDVLPAGKRMNPSDIDYEKYLMSKGISASLKGREIVYRGSEKSIKIKIVSLVEAQIKKIFQEQDQGIITTLLTGNDDHITEEVYRIYSKTGISHVLAISGFHIALLMSVCYRLCGNLGFPYTAKHLVSLSVIWAYAFLTGGSTSTLRACIMGTFVLIAKCLWEEEDFLTNLALAGWIILLINPFVITQAGFQLSFTAVGSLLVSRMILEKIEEQVDEKHFKRLKLLLPWLSITLGISPILALHFYEIPFVCSVLNILFIPLFSSIIIGAWISLILSLWTLKGAILLARLLIILLKVVLGIREKFLYMPLGTLCTGKPYIWQIFLYYGLLFGILCCIWGYIKKNICLYMALILISVGTFYKILWPKTLEVTYLYVGQGDGSVMITPHGKVMMIDAGNFGKGKTAERYLRYRGKKVISAFILSHSDEDHIGGLIDLLKAQVKIEHVFVSITDESPLMSQLLALCLEKKIPVYTVGHGDSFELDRVKVTALAPRGDQKALDNNNNSLGCLVEYGYFSGLFAGDMDKIKEDEMCDGLEPITALKVSHHGSKTSTSEEMLLKIKPRYAIISCGINNRYQHPHQSTLDVFEKYATPTLRTDKQGAVIFKTDGSQLVINTQVRGDE